MMTQCAALIGPLGWVMPVAMMQHNDRFTRIRGLRLSLCRTATRQSKPYPPVALLQRQYDQRQGCQR